MHAQGSFTLLLKPKYLPAFICVLPYFLLINSLICMCIICDGSVRGQLPGVSFHLYRGSKAQIQLNRHTIECSNPLNHFISSGHYFHLEWDTQGLQPLFWALWCSAVECDFCNNDNIHSCHSYALWAVRLSFRGVMHSHAFLPYLHEWASWCSEKIKECLTHQWCYRFFRGVPSQPSFNLMK